MAIRPQTVLCIILAAVTFTALAQSTVAEYSGNGLSNTRPFTVQDSWEVQWDANGDIFQIYVYDTNGNLIDIAANQMGPGTGASFLARGGSYYLQVNSIGRWSVRVVQLQRQSATQVTGPLKFEGDGTQTSRPFSVSGSWELQWSGTGDLFQAYLYSANGDLVNIAANQLGSGAGSSFQPLGGTYYLQVNAVGPWTLQVVPLD